MSRRRLLPMAALVIGLLGIIVASWAILHLQGGTRISVRTQYPTPIISDFPAPTPSASPSDLPPGMRIRIPDIGVNLEVVTGDGVNAPLYKAATFPAPLKLPGQGGRSMIYAHARTGMFGPLFNARVGQRIEVDENGRALNYVITEYYPRWPATKISWLQPLDKEQLILETCTTYNDNDPRIIVVAEPV